MGISILFSVLMYGNVVCCRFCSELCMNLCLIFSLMVKKKIVINFSLI